LDLQRNASVTKTKVKYALVGERIGGWCSILKARSNILVIAFKQSIKRLCYDSVWSMFDCRRYIFPTPPLSISEKKKLGEPKEEIGNLHGFECMYLSGLKVSYL
jgi:hypothetical protein